MSLVKKIGKKIIEGGIEAVKEEASEISEIGKPEKVIEQITGERKSAQGQGSEVTKYLERLDPKLTPQQTEEIRGEDQEQLEEARKVINLAKKSVPEHMKPTHKSEEESLYDKAWREREEREQAEKQKKELKEKVFVEPTTVRKKGDWKGGLGKKKAQTDMERKIDIRAG